MTLSYPGPGYRLDTTTLTPAHDDIYSTFLWQFQSAGIESFQTIPIFKKSGENRHIRK